MVVVTATRVNDGGLDLGWKRGDVGLDGGEAKTLERGAVGTFDDLVDVVDVGLVVLGMVDVHGGGVDVGFEGGIVVRKLGKSEGHVGVVCVREKDDRFER